MTSRSELRAFARNFGIAERNVSADAELVRLDEVRLPPGRRSFSFS